MSVDIVVFDYTHAQRQTIGRLALVDEPVQNMHGVDRLTDFGGHVHEVLRRANRIPR